MTQHTPGAWHIEHEYNVMDTNRHSVASCGGYQRTSIGDEEHLEKIANAKLIAAAPDMLAFIEKVAAWDFDSDDDLLYDVKNEAFAIIKKVRS